MGKFLELEGGYLVISFIILLVTLFVSSRPMFKKEVLNVYFIRHLAV